MKSFNVHTTPNEYSKRKQRRYNARKSTITVSRERIPPQIYATPNKIQYCENVKFKPIKQDFQIVSTNNGLKTKYLKDFHSVYFSTQQAKLLDVKLCSETMTLLPFIKNQRGQNVNRKNVRDTSALARLTMSALAASETDINSILELVETMYQTIHDMLRQLRDIKQKQNIYNPPETIEPERTEKPKYVIKIHLKKFMNYLNEQYIRFNSSNVPQNLITNGSESLPVPVRLPYCKQPSTSYINNKCRSFNILLQPRRMSFNITVCKFNSCSMDFFQRLAKFYNSCNLTYSNKRRKPVPSVFIRDWHFRNASQGYLLSVLLKHNNVMSLNVMRKLYFVIITSVTPNLTIEINFMLANGIFMAYDSPPFEKSSFEVIHFNDRHRNILESSSKIRSPYFTYNTPHMAADLNNDLLKDTKSDSTLHTNSSSDSSSTLKYESSSEYEGSDYFIKSTSYSQLGFFDLKNAASSTNLTIRESVKTLTLSIDDMLSYNVLLNARKDCGDMNFATTFQEQYNMYNSRIQQSRTWMSKVYKESTLNSELLMPYFNSVMNETVFDRVSVSIGDCFSTFNQYWSQIRSQTFCKLFLKDLGNYFLNSLLISLVYH